MAYVDYSSNFVLDQFFTFLNANVLGSNDQHLYDTFAVEHNINSSTIDGTHKVNSITGSMINTTPVSSGFVNLISFWLPVAGIYQFINVSGLGNPVYLELYISGAWQSSTNFPFAGGIVFCDGTNMRLNPLTTSQLWYQKF